MKVPRHSTPSRLRAVGLRPALRAVYLGRPACPPGCVDPHNAPVKLSPEWEAETLKLVLTGSAEDGPEWQKHLRSN